MAAGDAWDSEENSAIVAVYLRMLEAELLGRHMVKARANDEVQRLTGRGRGSVEYKFQNISAVLSDYRHPFVNGYKPAANYQESLCAEVLTQLQGRRDLVDIAFTTITRQAEDPDPAMSWREIDPPDVALPRGGSGRRAGHWDFVKLDAENRSLGLAGEIAVLARERRRLDRVGRGDLARRVEHASLTRGDGLGFDIRSFADDGAELFIEVKTTRLGQHWPMIISRNELKFSELEAARFQLARVFDFTSTRAGIYTLAGSVRDTCELSPDTYRALPRLI